ncbi:MAG: AAA family ATPase [Minisyncoccia bacterium]
MLIGISGTDGAGKGTLVDYLVTNKGFVHYSAREIWIEELNLRGMETSRANMRLIANEMREKFGNDFLITYYLKKIKEEGTQNAIIESIRAVSEAETLKANGGILIAVDADQKVRFSRVQERRSETDRVSFEQFKAHEELETNDPNPHGMQKQKVIAMADHIILNNGTLEELHAEIERFSTPYGLGV